ncbi:glycosyltransferase family 2 protein [Pantanalinema sp. GBBB05]|uniref:glycosyltransferase family 2 protein n=1 Tax=Pantanalinema sp. GBBB05 TaxID=2604139 RepID=UPI003D81532C
MATIDILIPTDNRPAALAVTLTSLCAQSYRNFRLVISDQTEEYDPLTTGEVQAALNVLAAHGHEIETHKHLPRKGLAEQRQFLLAQVTATSALYLDDDLILEPWVVLDFGMSCSLSIVEKMF